MDKLYIPTSSLNFNSIFSSESISPASFYASRNFGYKRYTKVDPNPFDFSLILYSSLPLFSIQDHENENYPIYIEIPKSIISPDSKSINFDGITIYQVTHSIYLSDEWTRIIFNNQKDRKSVLVRSEQSLETKLVNSYSNCFVLLNETKIDKFSWSKNYINQLNDLDSDISKSIAFDQAFNKAKGFIYGYTIGALMAKPKEFVELQKQLREIKNITSGLINIYNNYSRTSKNLKSKALEYIPKATYSEVQSRLKDLKNRAEIVGTLLKPFENIDEAIISSYLQKYEGTVDLNLLLQIFKELKPHRWSFYEQLEYAISSKGSKVTPLIHRLVNVAFNLFKSENGRILQTDSGINEISEVFSSLENSIANIERSLLMGNTTIEIAKIIFFSGLRLTQFNETLLSAGEQKIYQLITNSLLSQSYETSEGFKHSKSEIIYRIGKELKEDSKDWENNPIRNYLNNLIDSIESFNKPFNINEAKSPIWHSFSSFFLRGEEPERLIDFLISNGIEDYRYALGMWGSYFGFANMPRTTSDILFKNSDILYQKRIANYINSNILSYEIIDLPKNVESSRINETEIKEPNVVYPLKESLDDSMHAVEYFEKFKKLHKPKGWKPEYDEHVRVAIDFVLGQRLMGDINLKELRKKLNINKPKGFGDEKIDFVCNSFKNMI